MKKISKKTQKIPVGPLGMIPMEGTTELAKEIDHYLVKWRKGHLSNSDEISFSGYERDSFLISAKCARFSNGEAKGIINQTVRGYDLYILSDIGNYSKTYKMFGNECPMSPDDHFQDIKRVISAVAGKARNITVIMPLLYESRQHKRTARESLDCAMALKELENLGVHNIITFDAHDPRVQNAIPLTGFETIFPTYQIIKALLRDFPNLDLDKEKMLVISPDEGGIGRNLYYAQMLGLDLGLFYKRRDYTKIINGRNPIVSHEYLGDDVEGKSVIIVDDMLASGESMLDIAIELKKRKAKNIYMAVTFGLFTDGIDKFEKAYQEGLFTKLYATNLTYRRKELQNCEWFTEVSMSKFLAHLVNTLNRDESIGPLLNPYQKIKSLLDRYHSKNENT